MRENLLIKKQKVLVFIRWVKTHAHTIREMGLLFFTFALLTGVIWVSGRDVEPIVYMFGSISTLLIALPTIARRIEPDRKPVSNMSYDEIIDFILLSDAKLDWRAIKTDLIHEEFLKQDPLLRLSVKHGITDNHRPKNLTTWLNSIFSNSYCSYWYELYYGTSLLYRCILVSVGEEKTHLPIPDEGSFEIDPLNYKVAQIYDEFNLLDETLNNYGLSVKNSN